MQRLFLARTIGKVKTISPRRRHKRKTLKIKVGLPIYSSVIFPSLIEPENLYAYREDSFGWNLRVEGHKIGLKMKHSLTDVNGAGRASYPMVKKSDKFIIEIRKDTDPVKNRKLNQLPPDILA